MEKRDDIKGFNLNPLSKEEIQSVEQLIWQAFQCISDIPSTMYSVNGISGKVASLKKISIQLIGFMIKLLLCSCQ
jgi:hypothetical protein